MLPVRVGTAKWMAYTMLLVFTGMQDLPYRWTYSGLHFFQTFFCCYPRDEDWRGAKLFFSNTHRKREQ